MIAPGSVVGQWTVLAVADHARKTLTCRCSCGAEHIVYQSNLRSGQSTRCRSCARRANPPNRTHGRSRTLFYKAWRGMVERCHSPSHVSYSYYGGRGVVVCDEWRDFAAFAAYVDAHLGPRPDGHSLDRIDNSRGYEPGNVRWASHRDQMRNTRRTRRIDLGGETLTLNDLVARGTVSRRAIAYRLRHGWTPEEAISHGPRSVPARLAEQYGVHPGRTLGNYACSGCGEQGHRVTECAAARSAEAA